MAQADDTPTDPHNHHKVVIVLNFEVSATLAHPDSEDDVISTEFYVDPNVFTTAIMNTLAVAASLASITQVILMIVDMRSKKFTRRKTNKAKKSISRGLDEIEAIRLHMNDGSYIVFESWLTEPEKVKSFIEAFHSSSTSPKPVRVVFFLKNRTRLTVDVSENTASQQELDNLIKYLTL